MRNQLRGSRRRRRVADQRVSGAEELLSSPERQPDPRSISRKTIIGSFSWWAAIAAWALTQPNETEAQDAEARWWGGQ
jgi:hypothetical protein